MIKLPDEKQACTDKFLSEYIPQQPHYREAFNKGWNACLAEVQRLNAIAQPVSDGCKWSFDDTYGCWEAACGGSWVFNDGGPIENKCSFCQQCGGKVLLSAAPGGQGD